ncbi:DUF1803 domain-containing protein [Streptococcus halichoeri]|uniref:DUF1803 domain-containing protein n=1 Tax=Streptococcus halichoeri TaxID=254785 RepID=UPI0013573B4E|nr:DUF1803 domain-containing protein [Streptococcus halichoeri]
MLRVINSDKLTGTAYFFELINYLDQHEGVTLRQIKQALPAYPNSDRELDKIIEAGYVYRENRRYVNHLAIADAFEKPPLDQLLIIDDQSQAYQRLKTYVYSTSLTSQNNHLILLEETDFERQRLTLNNVFYKLAKGYPMSSQQVPLYQLLGDVNPAYAMKYISQWLLKFLTHDSVKQKRPDIFWQALVLLGYLKPLGDDSYQLAMQVEPESLQFSAQ